VLTDVALKRTLELSLEAQPGDAPVLAGAVALALAVIELNRPGLTAAAAVTYAGGDYGAADQADPLTRPAGPSFRTAAYYSVLPTWMKQ
jgi:D-serine deaminase-like pyridoxal phosphate-dependent protein